MPEPLTPAQIAYEAWVRSKECPEGPPTPGEVAYDAYVRHVQQQHAMSLWAFMAPDDRGAWEAAAQAVLAMQAEREREDPDA